jgi:hypothetical protein
MSMSAAPVIRQPYTYRDSLEVVMFGDNDHGIVGNQCTGAAFPREHRRESPMIGFVGSKATLQRPYAVCAR